MIKNTVQALKLAEQYEAINEDEITEAVNDLFQAGSCPSNYCLGRKALSAITGFGNHSQCKLCEGVSTKTKTIKSASLTGRVIKNIVPECDECIYSLAWTEKDIHADIFFCTQCNDRTIKGSTLANSYNAISHYRLGIEIEWDNKHNCYGIKAVSGVSAFIELIRFRALQIREVIKYEENNFVPTEGVYIPNPNLKIGGENA